MKTEDITERISALNWWDSLTFEEQFFLTVKWLSSQGRDTSEKHPHNLTGMEIQQIFKQKQEQ